VTFSEVVNDMKHRATSLQQLSFLVPLCLCRRLRVVDTRRSDVHWPRTSHGVGH